MILFYFPFELGVQGWWKIHSPSSGWKCFWTCTYKVQWTLFTVEDLFNN